MSLTIGVPREIFPGEKRVACVPEVAEKLIKLGFGVRVESGAGAAANFDDASYTAVGVQVAATTAERSAWILRTARVGQRPRLITGVAIAAARTERSPEIEPQIHARSR